MENKELLNILFAASKEGKLKGGDITCGAALSSGETELIILSKDASPALKTKFGQYGFKYEVDVVTFGNTFEFSWISGKKDIQVMVILDKEIAEEIKAIEDAGNLF